MSDIEVTTEDVRWCAVSFDQLPGDAEAFDRWLAGERDAAYASGYSDGYQEATSEIAHFEAARRLDALRGPGDE